MVMFKLMLLSSVCALALSSNSEIEKKESTQKNSSSYSSDSINQNKEHNKRQSTGSFVLYALSGYRNALVVNLPLGSIPAGSTSPQLIPTLIDIGHQDLLVPLPTVCSTTNLRRKQKRDIINLNSTSADTTRINKRDSGTCVAGGGYDYKISSTASIIPGLYQDTDFSIDTGTVSGTKKLKSRSSSQLYPAFFALRFIDKIIISTAISFLMPFAVTAYKAPPVQINYIPYFGNVPINPAALVAPVAPVAPVPPVAVLGLAGVPLPVGPPPNPAPVPALAIAAIIGQPNLPLQPIVQNQAPPPAVVQPPAFGFIMGLNQVYPDGGSGYFKRSNSHEKRATGDSCSSIMFRGYDVNKFSGNLAWFPVSGVIGTQSLWRLSLRNIAINMSASSNGAAINVNSKTNSQNNMDTIEFSTKSTYILLTSARVTSLYNLFGSNARAPSSAINPYFTYKCLAKFTISFEFVDIFGVSQLLTMDKRDFFHGFSPDAVGWCIGAIQPLNPGLTQQTIGLSFIQSFYTGLGLDTTLSASQIGLAVSKRQC